MEAVYKLDNDAIVIEPDDPTAALEKWKSAKALAEKELKNDPSPEWSYIAGYLSYMLFARDACSFAVAEGYLVDALAPGPKQRMAQFYLASIYFDTGKLRRAIDQLERIYKAGRDYFKGLGQEWRYVKSVEMLVAAQIRYGAWFEARAIGAQLEVVYRECEDRESMIPLALIGSLEETDSESASYEDLCRIAAGIARLTRSERAIVRLFPKFSAVWLQSTN